MRRVSRIYYTVGAPPTTPTVILPPYKNIITGSPIVKDKIFSDTLSSVGPYVIFISPDVPSHLKLINTGKTYPEIKA